MHEPWYSAHILEFARLALVQTSWISGARTRSDSDQPRTAGRFCDHCLFSTEPLGGPRTALGGSESERVCVPAYLLWAVCALYNQLSGHLTGVKTAPPSRRNGTADAETRNLRVLRSPNPDDAKNAAWGHVAALSREECVSSRVLRNFAEGCVARHPL